MAQSGCRWSTCGAGMNACSGVSIDAATRLWPNADRRIVVHHLVFERFAAIAGLELFEFVEIQQREPRIGDRAEIAAAAFHREHADGRARERIGHVDLGARVAAAEVRDAQIGAEQIRAIAKQRQLIAAKPIGRSVVPEIVRCFRAVVSGIEQSAVLLEACRFPVPCVHVARREHGRSGTSDR